MNPEIENKPEKNSSKPPQNEGLVQGFAITGIVLAFLQLQLIGLVFSIIAKVKATKGTTSNTLAIVGIVLNIVLGIITIGIVAAIVVVAYNGINQRTQEISNQVERRSDERMSLRGLQERVIDANMAADDMSKIGFAYSAMNGSYATTAAQLQTLAPLKIVSTSPLDEAPLESNTVEYAACDNGKTFRVGVWNFVNDDVVYRLYPEEYKTSVEPNCSVVGQFINTKSLSLEDQKRIGL